MRTSRRWGWFASFAVAVLLLAAGCAQAGTAIAGCDRANSAPFDCHVYRTIGGTDASGGKAGWLRSHPLRMWFEHLNGVLTLIVVGPVNVINLPVQAHATGATSDGSGMATSSVGCTGGPTCDQDSWLQRFFTKSVTYGIDGDQVVLRSAFGTIAAARTATMPKLQRTGVREGTPDGIPVSFRRAADEAP